MTRHEDRFIVRSRVTRKLPGKICERLQRHTRASVKFKLSGAVATSVVGQFVDLKVDVGTPIEILEDNQGAIAMAKNLVGHKRTKHIDIRHHFIQEAAQNGTISLTYCPTKEMVADIFTKPLPWTQFKKTERSVNPITNRGGV